MVSEEAWLELAEISPGTLQTLGVHHLVGDHAIQVTCGDDTGLCSMLFEPIPGPLEETETNNAVIGIHPILHNYLTLAASMMVPPITSGTPVGVYSNSQSMPVRLVPLRMTSSLPIVDGRNSIATLWHLSCVPIQNSCDDAKEFLSTACMYLDPQLCRHLQETPEVDRHEDLQ